MGQRKRAVITGIGMATCLGTGLDKTWAGVLEGKTGIKTTSFDSSTLKTHFGGEIADFDYSDFIDKKAARRMDRFAHFNVACALMALEDAQLEIDPELALRTGIIVSSGIGGLESLHRMVRHMGWRLEGSTQPLLAADVDRQHRRWSDCDAHRRRGADFFTG